MNMLVHPSVRFHCAGLFQNKGPWIHSERIESTYEIIYVVRGSLYLREEEREYCVKEGQLVLLSPDLRHVGSRPSRDVAFYWVHFSLSEGEVLPFRARFFDYFENEFLFKELLHCHNLPSSPDYLVNAVLLHILGELCLLSGEHEPHPNALAEKVYEWIRINADARLTVTQVSEQFRYSTDHLCRLCKQSFGVGTRELIDRFLCERAKSLLCNTEAYIKEIALELNFPSDKAFIGFFKYHEGCSPSAFRNRFGKIHMNSH